VRLSFSRVSAYRRCPYQYRLGWVERVPPPTRPYTRLANALHIALAAYHRPGAGSTPTLEILLGHYWGAWSGYGPLSAYDERQRRTGEEILSRYFAGLGGVWPSTLYVEMPFEVQLGPHTLFGRLDRVDDSPRGLEVVDYKTAETPSAPPDTLQLDVYSLGLETLVGQLPSVVSFYYLRSNEKLSFERGRADAAATRAHLEGLARTLEADWRLEPTPGPVCVPCPYRAYCPAIAENPLPIPSGDTGQLRLDL
jgi:RecB family exonuclease